MRKMSRVNSWCLVADAVSNWNPRSAYVRETQVSSTGRTLQESNFLFPLPKKVATIPHRVTIWKYVCAQVQSNISSIHLNRHELEQTITC